MYRSPSPFAPENQYHPQPFVPPGGGQINPGSVTYTTSTGPDGRIVYHPFKAVAASYQTPNGVVTGIQWVPAETTQILPSGAQPATTDFAASWNRSGYLNKDEQRALKDWQHDEDKRRKKEEKESTRRLREQQAARDPEYELRMARERDAQATIARERRKSFNAGAAPGVAFPTGTNPYGGAPGASGYPNSPYQSYAAPGGVQAASGGTGYPRNTSGAYNDLNRQFGELGLREGEKTERERKTSFNDGTLARPRKYSMNEGAGERTRTVSGNFGERPMAYGGGGAYGTTPSTTGGYSGNRPYGTGASPNMRPVDLAYAPTAASGYPGSNFTASPNRAPRPLDPISRSTTPFGAGSGGRPVVPQSQQPPRSRATTPIPGMGGPNALSGVSSYNPNGVFPQATIPNLTGSMGGASPRLPAPAFPPDQHQLAAPEAFGRPINTALPFTPFDTMKIQDMDDFLEYLPRMPLVLQPHDVFHEDWIRLMQDLALAWAGKLPVPDLMRGGRVPKRATLAGDLLDLWNNSFFLVRGVEVVLYKGRERRSGKSPGVKDLHLPNDDDDSLSSSDSESEDDSEDDYGRAAGPYGRPGEISEARRRRREAKEERRRKRREKKLRRKERAKESKYALYIISTKPGGSGMHPYPTMPGSYGIPSSHGHGGGY